MTHRRMHLRIADRFINEIISGGLEFNSGYGELFGELARLALSVSKDKDKPIDMERLVNITNVGYSSFYSKYFSDIKINPSTITPDELMSKTILKLDMFFLVHDSNMYLIVDTYPESFGYIPGIGFNTHPTHFHLPPTLSIN